jgi:hypothetical protein
VTVPVVANERNVAGSYYYVVDKRLVLLNVVNSLRYVKQGDEIEL